MTGNGSDWTVQRVYREVNRFGLFLSVVGAGIVLYYGAFVVAVPFILSGLFFVYTLRELPFLTQDTETEQ